jgi:hypothetical protein
MSTFITIAIAKKIIFFLCCYFESKAVTWKNGCQTNTVFRIDLLLESPVESGSEKESKTRQQRQTSILFMLTDFLW